jgi:hypothetical protein
VSTLPLSGIKSRIEWAAEGPIPAEEQQVLLDMIGDLDEWLLIWKPKLTGESE